MKQIANKQIAKENSYDTFILLSKRYSLCFTKSHGAERVLCYLKTNFSTMIKFWGKVIFLPSKVIEEGRARLARTGNVNIETEIIVK